jgi:ABC-type antimicrobial peptide transport system permease subunit
MLGFGAAALALAAVGMLGVIAYVISQQVGELAVRQALGATRGQIIIAVMRDGAIVAAAGVAIGSATAWWMGRLVSTYVFNVSARDPMVLGISAATVAVPAMLPTFVPARRAASTGLAQALRD